MDYGAGFLPQAGQRLSGVMLRAYPEMSWQIVTRHPIVSWPLADDRMPVHLTTASLIELFPFWQCPADTCEQFGALSTLSSDQYQALQGIAASKVAYN